jgi:ubiquinone/menaquinone biosynthesis C-methylase UbiE
MFMKQRHSYDFDQFNDVNRTEELQRLEKQATIGQQFEKELLQGLDIPRTGRIVEIGCGPGFVTGLMASIFPEESVLGIDNSTEMISVANKVVKPVHPNVDFMEGDAYSTSLPDNFSDLVYGRMLYQHLNNPKKAATEAIRILKSRGQLCVVDVDAGFQFIEPPCDAFDNLNRLAGEAQRAYGGDRCIGRKLPHIMQSAGFRDIRFETITITSLDIPLEEYLTITTRFKAMLVGTIEAKKLMEQVLEHCQQQPTPLLMVGIVACVGRKP